jgi:queuine tRNA-ribosyltransferase
MPVGTQATVKSLTPGDLRAAGAQIILANTYHLSLRPGAARIAALGGLHRFMGWQGPILTDSGGFQVFSLAQLRRVDEDGVTFSSHLDGSRQRLTPERAIHIQEQLGSDVAMVLDQLVDPRLPSAEVEAAMHRTHRWAERCLAARSRSDQALFGIVQGGIDTGLRRRSAGAIRDLPFDGIAIGGLSVGESKGEMASTLDIVAEELEGDSRVRYLMGVGAPADFFTAVERAAHPGGSQRPAVDERREAQPAQRPLPRRSTTDRCRLPVRDLPRLSARLCGAPVPRGGAARVSPRLGP